MGSRKSVPKQPAPATTCLKMPGHPTSWHGPVAKTLAQNYAHRSYGHESPGYDRNVIGIPWQTWSDLMQERHHRSLMYPDARASLSIGISSGNKHYEDAIPVWIQGGEDAGGLTGWNLYFWFYPKS